MNIHLDNYEFIYSLCFYTVISMAITASVICERIFSFLSFWIAFDINVFWLDERLDNPLFKNAKIHVWYTRRFKRNVSVKCMIMKPASHSILSKKLTLDFGMGIFTLCWCSTTNRWHMDKVMVWHIKRLCIKYVLIFCVLFDYNKRNFCYRSHLNAYKLHILWRKFSIFLGINTFY